METTEAALQGGGAGVSARIWSGGMQIWEERSPPPPLGRIGGAASFASKTTKELIRLATNG